MKLAPVALFVYNRPRHTRQMVEALRNSTLAGDSDVFIFADAARTPEAASAVKQVRDYVRTIDGFRTLTIVERPGNLGLAKSIVDGVTQLVERFGRVIVLEDDLVTSRYFLEFMNTALDRYEGEERVMQIAGYMFPESLVFDQDSLFLPFISSWGWATWRRAWRHFEARPAGYERVLADSALRRRFDLNGNYSYSKILRAALQGKIDSWAVWWYLSVFLRNGLVLFPRKTMVRNLGFDGSGVNCVARTFAQDDLEPDFRVAVLPQRIDVSLQAEAVMSTMPRPKLSAASVLNSLMRFIRNSPSRVKFEKPW